MNRFYNLDCSQYMNAWGDTNHLVIYLLYTLGGGVCTVFAMDGLVVGILSRLLLIFLSQTVAVRL